MERPSIVAKWQGDHYSVVSVRPYNGSPDSLWGNPEWSGRLAFPLRADAGTAPSKASHQTIKPQSERDGQEVVSEKFHLTSDAKPNQPIVTIKKRRGLDVKRSADGNLEGFFDPATGKSFLIADNLTAESAPGTLMHEVGIHMAADGKLEPLFTRAAQLLKLGKNNPFIQRVNARMEKAGETSAEEAAAYIVTEYENDRANAPASVTQWVKDFIAQVRAWLFKNGMMLKADQLTVADIAAVARANAKSMANAASETTNEVDSPSAPFWQKIKAGESFTDSEVVNALGQGTRGTSRSGVVATGQRVEGSGSPGLQSVDWAGKIAGFAGYRTVAFADDRGVLTVAVIPGHLAGRVTSEADAEGSAIARYRFTDMGGEWQLDIADLIPDGKAFKALKAINIPFKADRRPAQPHYVSQILMVIMAILTNTERKRRQQLRPIRE